MNTALTYINYILCNKYSLILFNKESHIGNFVLCILSK